MNVIGRRQFASVEASLTVRQECAHKTTPSGHYDETDFTSVQHSVVEVHICSVSACNETGLMGTHKCVFKINVQIVITSLRTIGLCKEQ